MKKILKFLKHKITRHMKKTGNKLNEELTKNKIVEDSEKLNKMVKGLYV